MRILIFLYAQPYICPKKSPTGVYEAKSVCYNIDIIIHIIVIR